MDWFIEIFRENPVIPLFLVIGAGYWLGSLRYKSFTLGPVTATLIIGVIVGQMDIPMSDGVKTFAFMLFLFAIGYSVGPQFFRSLRGEGLKQIGFAIVEFAVVVGVTVVVCRLMGYNKGIAVGMFAGSQTVSATIGVGADTMRALGMPAEQVSKLVSYIPAVYAVTYVFGTIGSAWVIANFGPVLLGGLKKAKEETRRLEEELDTGDFVPEDGQINANRPVSFRAYRLEAPYFSRSRTVRELEHFMKAHRHNHFVERLRVNGEIAEPDPDTRIRLGDTVVLSGRRESIVENASWIGPEVTDHELLNFATENLPVTVSKRGADGLTLGELRQKPFMHGVSVHKLVRNDVPLPLKRRVRLERGDVITLMGLPDHVADAVPEIGYSDRNTVESDMTFIGLGIAIGCLVGAIVIKCGGIPLTLSTSGGAILSGLVLGWLRSRKPTYGHIPSQTLWFLNNFGLSAFIAVVGISSGPTFIEGLREVGISVFFVGILCTTLPLVICMLIGNKLFRFPVAVTLGCVAGSRNAVAALGAIQESLDSTVPVMGYTVTYAVSSVLLIFAGIIVPLLI